MNKLIVTCFLIMLSALGAEINYDIQDIGTLQTHSSQAIALNNKGQILGCYNINGTNEGKRFFLRNKSGDFLEIPKQENGTNLSIEWRYLTDNGKVYGIHDHGSHLTLFIWDEFNGVVKLDRLPGREISAINNVGQVLIKCVSEKENGKLIARPVIWQNGKITKLHGLEGDIGIESEESYGLDMNNKGEVVGQSVVFLSYKNNIYKQTHATMWVDGKAIDLHKNIPKSSRSSAIGINDLGEILSKDENDFEYLIGKKGLIEIGHGLEKFNMFYLYNNLQIIDKYSRGSSGDIDSLTKKIKSNHDSIWMKISKIINVNDNGEIIAQGETIYGENHAIFLTPVKSN